MLLDTFARIAAATHRAVPEAIAQPALEQAIAALHAMHPIDAAAGRALVRAVLDSGNPSLVAEAWRVLPQILVGGRSLPTSFITESPTDGVSASRWNGDAPNADAARLWIWANNLDGENGFSLLKRTQGGDAKTDVTPSLRMAIAIASLDDLDWSVPENTHIMAGQLLVWRLSGLAADVVSAIEPIDRRLATLPVANWVQAWKAERSLFSLPIVKDVAMGDLLVDVLRNAQLGHKRKHGLVVPMPTTVHGVLSILHAVPERKAFEAMTAKERVEAMRAIFGTPEQIANLAWKHTKDSPEAVDKRNARARRRLERAAQATPSIDPASA